MALSKYSIWDKTSEVITPSGKIYSAEQWKEKYPIASVDGVTIVGSYGLMNGGFFGVLETMVNSCINNGCDFTGCTTDIEKLERIEAFENLQNVPSTESTAEERIASSLEILALNGMTTVNEDDPDLD